MKTKHQVGMRLVRKNGAVIRQKDPNRVAPKNAASFLELRMQTGEGGLQLLIPGGQLDRQKREWPRYSQWVGIINITLEKPTMRSARARLATMKPTRGQSSPGCHSTFATTHGGF